MLAAGYGWLRLVVAVVVAVVVTRNVPLYAITAKSSKTSEFGGKS